MKKQCMLLIASAALLTTAVDAAPKLVPAKSISVYNELINEDFSKVTEGSLNDYSSYLLCNYFTGPQEIDAEYTQTPGWTGHLVYQCDGAVVLKTPNPMQPAFIALPKADYSGEITISFRAMALGNGGNGMYVNFLAGSDDADVVDGSASNYQLLYKYEGWKDFEITVINNSADNDGTIEITCDRTIVIDDIQVKSTTNYIACPKVQKMYDFTADSFKADFEPTRNAFDYRCWLVKRTVVSDEDAIILEDYDDQNVNAYPSGNGFQYSGSVLVSDNTGEGGSHGLTIKNNGWVVTPFTGSIYKALNAWFKVNTPNNSADYLGNARMKIYLRSLNGVCSSMSLASESNYDGLKELGHIKLSDFDADGEELDFAYELSLDQRQCYGVAFQFVDMPEGVDVTFDSFMVETEPEAEVLPVVYGMTLNTYAYNFASFYDPVTGETTYPDEGIKSVTKNDETGVFTIEFKNLDEYGEYYFSPVSHYRNQESEPNLQLAFGVAAPEVQLPFDMSASSYCAQWDEVAKATRYEVTNYSVDTVEADGEYVLLHETFSKVESTKTNPSSPEYLYNEEGLLDDYTDVPGWTGVSNTAVNGMLGSGYYGAAIVAPALYLNNSDTFTMHLVAYGSYGDYLVVTVNGVDYAMTFNSNGKFDNDIYFNETGREVRIAFSSYNGYPIMLDDVKVTQNLEEGDYVYTIAQRDYVDAPETQYEFEDLEENSLCAFSVRAIYDRGSESAYSNFSDLVLVDLGSGRAGITSLEDGSADCPLLFTNSSVSIAEIYTVNGQKVERLVHGVNIVKMTDGTIRKIVVR